MMVSKVRYPSFKSLDFRARRNFFTTLLAILFLGSVVVSKGKVLIFVLPVFFTAYLVYGFVRPRISRRVRHEIEDEEDEDTAEAG
jgi:CDP-diacylglycerol--serine O-phosphatidyltransferase